MSIVLKLPKPSTTEEQKLQKRLLALPSRHLINICSDAMTRVIRTIRMDRMSFPMRSTCRRSSLSLHSEQVWCSTTID